MPIPKFSIDGVLPPFVGETPAGHATDMSPYRASALEVVRMLGTTAQRQVIMKGWLDHRAELRRLRFGLGFQWLDGSFVEDKVPNDLDIVSFTHRPPAIYSVADMLALMAANPDVFRRAPAKAKFHLDVFFVDLSGSAESAVNVSRYFLQLFSHRRDGLWKGMLQVALDTPADDEAASKFLKELLAANEGGVVGEIT